MKPVNENGDVKSGSTHDKFTAEMAKKTVTNRLAKRIINTSSDSDLLIQMVRQNDMDNYDASVQAEIDDKANQEIIDIPSDDEQTKCEDNSAQDEQPMTEEEKAAIEAEELAAAEIHDGPGY